jgi:2,3-bisphosphoglycerate-independent phosphoglycerate mutase
MVGVCTEDVPGMTASLDTDYRATGRRAIELVERYDTVYVHIDAPDEASHLGDAEAKCDALSRIDAEIVGPLMEHMQRTCSEWRVTVVPDHYTLVSTMAHDDRPVPFATHGSAGVPALVSAAAFSEDHAQTAPVWDPQTFRSLCVTGPMHP